jgi:uncharacterized membrane protein YdbT with pleckstrin-like domain
VPVNLRGWPPLGEPRGNERYVAYGESVVLDVRRHVAILLRPSLSTIAVIVVASVIGGVASPDSGGSTVDNVMGLVVLVAVLRWLWTLLQWWLDRVVVTDQRVFEVSGVLTKNVGSMPLWKVTDMTYRRTVPGRIFGYGAMILESAGQEQALDYLNFLPQSDHFYRTVTAQAGGTSPRGSSTQEEEQTSPDAEEVAVHDADDTGPIPPVIV